MAGEDAHGEIRISRWAYNAAADWRRIEDGDGWFGDGHE